MISRSRALDAALEAAREAGWDTLGANAVRWEEAVREPVIANLPPPPRGTSHWVIYFPWHGTHEMRNKECQIAIVHGLTGDVLHLGGAGDVV